MQQKHSYADIPALQHEESNLRHRGDYDGALRILDAILVIDPSFSPALNNKAAILLMRKAFSDALPLLKKAVEVDPLNGQAFNNLGWALLKTGDAKQAAYSLDRALELGYTHEGVRYNLAVAYLSLAMVDKALDEWEKVLRANPLNIEVLKDVYRLAQAVGARTACQTDIDETTISEIRNNLKSLKITVFPPHDGEETTFLVTQK